MIVAALGLAVAGFFLFKSERSALVFPALVLAPILAFQRKNTRLLLSLAAVSILVGFGSCAANFRWAGG